MSGSVWVRTGVVFAILLLTFSCAVRQTSRIGEPEAPGAAAVPERNGASPGSVDPGRSETAGDDGIPKPPTLSELSIVGEVPAGSPSIDGLPGGNEQVNQDTTTTAQNETSIVVSPTDPLNVVGGWNDYNVVNTGQNTVIGYGWTTDGGATWQSDRIAFSSLPANQSTGDPAFTADTQGNFYMGILAYNGTAPGILVSKSVDGGATWLEPVSVDSGGDKEFLTVDPANDHVYLVWENSTINGQTIFFSKSTDLGASFSSRLAISSSGSTGNGAYPAVGPNGEIYVCWSNFSSRVYFDRSLDGGATWLSTDVIVDGSIVKPRDPLAGGFRNPMMPAIAVDRSTGPNRGRIYIVWPDQRFGDPDVVISYSDDLGDTWSAPRRVNDDILGNNADQFFPWVTVDDNGGVHVTFLDRREDPDGMLFAMYLATSTDGAVTFGPNIRVSDGNYGPSNFGFLGDYTGASAGSDLRIHPLWPDGRNGDEDVFSKSVDLADYDEDGILNDGNGDGQYASARCTGGNNLNCDDNCPGEPNPGQADGDGDQVGDACDNCPADANVDQGDLDRDGFGDVCDQCPGQVGGDGADPDLDGVSNCVDNCPLDANPGQEDVDGDGVGDACDPCPNTALNDQDGDGFCGDVDNCAAIFNPVQLDSDGDGAGDLCDVCPAVSDPGQADQDGDGAGDACDCQPADGGDRAPGEVASLTVNRTGGTANLSWSAVGQTDAYSVSRGDLVNLGVDAYGDCFAEGVLGTSMDDVQVPASGSGFFYLVQGQNYDCGLGFLGYTSDEAGRNNQSAAACQGGTFSDNTATGDVPVDGTVFGSFNDTPLSDDVTESIEEVESKGGKPSLRHTFLEHRWSFDIPAGSLVELHVEGFRTNSSDGDNFTWSYSTDGGAAWQPVTLASLPFSDNGVDLVGVIPASVSGSLLVRVVDTNRNQGGLFVDKVSVDQLFLRVAP